MISKSDEKRLADIRVHAETWCAIYANAREWDNYFLLRIIDKLKASRPKELKTGKLKPKKNCLTRNCGCRYGSDNWRDRG